MKTKHILLLVTLCISAFMLSSCSINAMADWLDTRSVDTDFVQEHAIEFTTMLSHEVLVVDTTDTEKKRTLPAGTKLRIMAVVAAQPQAEDGPRVTYMVELPGTSRYLCALPEMLVGRRVAIEKTGDSITIENIQRKTIKGEPTVFYSCRDSINGLKEYAYKDIDWEMGLSLPRTQFSSTRYLGLKYLNKELIGKSFEEVEQFLKPAQNVSVKGRTKLARYNHIGTTDKYESTFYRRTLVLFQDNKATNIYSEQRFSFPLSGFPGFLTISKYPPLLINAGYDYYLIPRFPFLNLQFLGGTARETVSGILLIFFLAFLVFLPALFSRWTIYYIKPLPNGIIKILGWIMIIAVFITATISLCYDEGWLVVIMQTAFFIGMMLASFSIVNIFVESYRCPNCHSVGSLTGQADSNKKSDTFRSKVKTQDQYSHSSTSGNTRTDYYDRKKYRTKTTFTSWNENYHCRKCASQFHYRKSSSSSSDVDA